jgi:AcrR family transcriptional regulator
MARPSPALLSREAIIDVAWRIIDGEGASALSMRRLAADLGVSGPSLYHHFVSKDEILDGIVIRIYEQIEITGSPSDWEEILTTYAMQLRALLTAHPHVVEFVALRPVTATVGLRIYEDVIRGLTQCGWSPALAREAMLALESLVFGSALMANAPDIELDPEQRIAFPMLAETSEGPADNPPDDGFELGFAGLMAGLRVLVIETPASGRPAPRRRARSARANGAAAPRRRAS